MDAAERLRTYRERVGSTVSESTLDPTVLRRLDLFDQINKISTNLSDAIVLQKRDIKQQADVLARLSKKVEFQEAQLERQRSLLVELMRMERDDMDSEAVRKSRRKSTSLPQAVERLPQRERSPRDGGSVASVPKLVLPPPSEAAPQPPTSQVTTSPKPPRSTPLDELDSMSLDSEEVLLDCGSSPRKGMDDTRYSSGGARRGLHDKAGSESDVLCGDGGGLVPKQEFTRASPRSPRKSLFRSISENFGAAVKALSDSSSEERESGPLKFEGDDSDETETTSNAQTMSPGAARLWRLKEMTECSEEMVMQLQQKHLSNISKALGVHSTSPLLEWTTKAIRLLGVAHEPARRGAFGNDPRSAVGPELSSVLRTYFLTQTTEGARREFEIGHGEVEGMMARLLLEGIEKPNKTKEMIKEMRWWSKPAYSGNAYMMGGFFLSDVTELTNSLLKSKQVRRRMKTISITSLGNTDSVASAMITTPTIISEFYDRARGISCGPNTACVVSDLGELFLSSPAEMHHVVLGEQKDPLNWPGEFSINKLLGRWVISVASGANHVAAITADEEVVLWGINYDPLELCGSNSQPRPTAQLNDERRLVLHPTMYCGLKVSRVSCGWAHTVVLSQQGIIFTCGSNSEGQLGRDGGATMRIVPLTIPCKKGAQADRVVDVAAGFFHTFALTAEGSLFGWGSNSDGQLGLGSLDVARKTEPTHIKAIFYCLSVSCGALHTAAVVRGNVLFTWGNNGFGQLGTREPVVPQSTQSSLPVSRRFSQPPEVVRGPMHTVHVEGENVCCQPLPSEVGFFVTKRLAVHSVSCGAHTTAAVVECGDAYIWGMLADEDLCGHQSIPRRVDALHTQQQFVTQVACGSTHFLFHTDKRLSAALEAMIAACSRGAPFNLSPLKTELLAIPDPIHMLGIVQDRALNQYLERESWMKVTNFMFPHVTVDQAFVVFNCPMPDKLMSAVTVRNLSHFAVTCKVTVDNAEHEGFSVNPPQFTLEARKTTTVNVSFVFESMLTEEVLSLIKITAVPVALNATEKDSKKKKKDKHKSKRRPDQEILEHFDITAEEYEKHLAVAREVHENPDRLRRRSTSYYYVLAVARGTARSTFFDSDSWLYDVERSNQSDVLALVTAMTTYVPQVLLRKMIKNPNPPRHRSIEQFEAAILFIDISGFTSLNERLAQLGSKGPELVSRHINAYFGDLIKAVSHHGGDVLKFAGDALICMFGGTECEESLPDLTLRAVSCGFEIQTELARYDSNEGFQLTLHIGIGSGNLYSLYVGGQDGSWEYLVCGEPLAQLRTAVDNSHTGEVVVSKESWRLIESRCVGEPRGDDYYVQEIMQPLEARGAPELTVPVEAEPALRCFIPQAVLSRLDSGQIGWMDELRVATVLFVKLNGELDTSDMEDFCASLDAILRCMQRVIFRYEGMVRQFLSDDKGTVLIAAFGLPPFSHDNDCVRGVKAAQEISCELESMNMPNTIGVTTGRLYCGSVGSNTRQEYAMVGDMVNLAARLMVAADKKCVPILTDETTYKASKSKIAFDTLEPIRVKGKSVPINVFVPLPGFVRQAYGSPTVVGRYQEKGAISAAISKLEKVTNSHTQLMVFEGVSGMGKSSLVSYALSMAMQYGVRTCCGRADPLLPSPFSSWSSVLVDLLGLPDDITPEQGKAANKKLHRDIVGTQLKYLPLLTSILPELAIPETSFTEELSQQRRILQTIDLLKFLLYTYCRKPSLLIFEDVHVMDNASLMALLEIRKLPQNILIIVTTQPIQPPVPVKHKQLFAAAEKSYYILEGLSVSSCCVLACTMLEIQSLPEAIEKLFATIIGDLQGNPFFVCELINALLASGAIKIEKNQCIIGAELEQIMEQSAGKPKMPESVLNIISSRLDLLTPLCQLVIKVASVIGETFGLSYLKAIYPVAREIELLPQALDMLIKLDLIVLKKKSLRNVIYLFKTPNICKVAYSRMLFAQRKQLHLNLAEHLADLIDRDVAPSDVYEMLARHWFAIVEGDGDSAEERALLEALKYVEKASEITYQHCKQHKLFGQLGNSVVSNAVMWMQRVLLLLDRLPQVTNRKVRIAQCTRRLAALSSGK